MSALDKKKHSRAALNYPMRQTYYHKQRGKHPMPDVRDTIFCTISGKTVPASISAEEGGILAGTDAAFSLANEIGLTIHMMLPEGSLLAAGTEIVRFSGSPKQIAMAEEKLIGAMAKPSGVASAARIFVNAADGKVKIVSGSWKKMPSAIKDAVRSAVTVGGASFRITDDPFLYLDKNFVKMFDGIVNTLSAVSGLKSYTKVIQITGAFEPIAVEAKQAIEHGAQIIFVDTGNPDDVTVVTDDLRQHGLRGRVRIAFAGNVKLNDLPRLCSLDIDILGVGRQIVDAPLLDMHLEVKSNA